MPGKLPHLLRAMVDMLPWREESAKVAAHEIIDAEFGTGAEPDEPAPVDASASVDAPAPTK